MADASADHADDGKVPIPDTDPAFDLLTKENLVAICLLLDMFCIEHKGKRTKLDDRGVELPINK